MSKFIVIFTLKAEIGVRRVVVEAETAEQAKQLILDAIKLNGFKLNHLTSVVEVTGE